MTVIDIAKMLDLDSDSLKAVSEYDPQINYNEISDRIALLQSPQTWGDGLAGLKEYCGDDPQGMKILTIYLHCLINTHERYIEKGIPEKVFVDTMGFIPRFIKSNRDTWGVSAFTMAWWFPREISMNEFRIGDYEYEFFNDNGVKKMWLHIPSDANLATADIKAIYPFVEKFYPEYSNAQICCDSWLLAPALKDILPEGSNILSFQNKFEIKRTDPDASWFMGWIWPRCDMPLEDLAENTTLQRNAKKYLLAGGKIGTAYGEYIG